jgi:hypothetical protein
MIAHIWRLPKKPRIVLVTCLKVMSPIVAKRSGNALKKDQRIYLSGLFLCLFGLGVV